MSLDVPPTGKEPIAIAEEAIVYALRRIRDDANVGYHCGLGTQLFHLLVQAASRLNNVPVDVEIEAGRFYETSEIITRLKKLLEVGE
jgi:hypothetical protein